MKRIIVLVCCVFAIFGCNNNSVEKPQNLIEKDKMVDILYDMALLEAIKNQNISDGISNKVGNEYIYIKYKIDSLQFAKSNKYYAGNIEQYKKMYEEVKTRLTIQTQEVEKNMKKNGEQIPPTTPVPTTPNIPQAQ